MTADEVAAYAMTGYTKPDRTTTVTYRTLVAFLVGTALLVLGFMWACGMAERANLRADRSEADMLLLQTRCTVFEDMSATCPAGTFEAAR